MRCGAQCDRGRGKRKRRVRQGFYPDADPGARQRVKTKNPLPRRGERKQRVVPGDSIGGMVGPGGDLASPGPQGDGVAYGINLPDPSPFCHYAMA